MRVEERGILRAPHLFSPHRADDLDPRAAQGVCASALALARLGGPVDDPRHARAHESIGARRGLTLVVARLQADEGGGALCATASLAERHDLRVGSTEFLVISLPYQAPVTHDDTAHERIGVHAPPATPRESPGPLEMGHVFASEPFVVQCYVVHGCLVVHGQ